MEMSLGSLPRAAIQLPRGADSQARRRAAHALPGVVPAAVPLVDSPAVPAPVSSDPPNVPVRLPSAADYWEFAWWQRALGPPSLRVIRWYLRAYPHLDFGKIPLSLVRRMRRRKISPFCDASSPRER